MWYNHCNTKGENGTGWKSRRFFDIDGTLVNDRKSVLKSTKDAIKIVKEQGVLVGVATGRGPFFVKELMEDLDLDFAVTYNGQYIFNKEKVLFASPIAKSSLRSTDCLC